MLKALPLSGRILTGLCLSLATLALPARSSHREAPGITRHPKVDGTDFYMFRSYETGRGGYVTIVANYQPFQATYGGPNFFPLDPDALYEIHIDNNGDGREDLTFQFRFTNTLKDIQLAVGPAGSTKNVSVPLVNVGPITSSDQSNSNLIETYTVTMVKGDRRAGTATAITNATGGSTTFTKPTDNIGVKTFPNYDAYANAYVYNINVPGFDGVTRQGKVFVGQRKDPFVVALGGTFDLVNLNPLGPTNVAGADSLKDDNVTSIILELPIAGLLSDPNQPIIGGWTTASLRQARVVNPKATYAKPDISGGAWTQVSRLGMPLVNEVVIGVKDKDHFNSSQPKDDAQFIDYVTNPTLPALLQALFGVQAPTLFPRTDLEEVFLTGVPGLNSPPSVVPSEMLRLNTSTAVTAAASQSNLGVLGGDNAGFPNGRRPGDDVVDMALRVVMGALIYNPAATPNPAPDGNKPYTDGAYVDSTFFNTAFPYLKAPLPGSN